MTVAIVKAKAASGVRDALDLLGGIERFVKPGERVVVKPNICAGKESSTGAVTDPELVAELCCLVAGAGGEARVVESPIYPFKSSRVFQRAGYGDFESKYGYPLIDVDRSEAVEIRIPKGKAVQREMVAREVLEADRLINVPVLKTHLQTLISCGLKNIKGVVPGRHKHIIHIAGLDEGIVDINTVIRSDLVLVDGIIAMEGPGGPTNGTPLHLGLIIAGDNVVEVDAACARIMGLDPSRITHVRRAAERGLGILEGFEVLGEKLEEVRRDFAVPRYPSLNRFMISEVLVKGYNLLGNLFNRVLGREIVRARGAFGEVRLIEDRCNGCGVCVQACPVGAITMSERFPAI